MCMLNYLLANKLYLVILTMPFVAHMLYDFFQKGMVFEIYGNWLFKEDDHNKPLNDNIELFKKEQECCETTDAKKKELQRLIDNLESLKIETPAYKKPLGNCIKCFFIWICIVFTFVFSFYLHGFHWSTFLTINIIKWCISVSIAYFILTNTHIE